MKNQTNSHKLKPEFFNKLVELGVYEKWEEAWKNDRPVSEISKLNEYNCFCNFIEASFCWVSTEDGPDFWLNIADHDPKN